MKTHLCYSEGVVMLPKGGLQMEKILLGRHSFLNSRPRWLRALGISLLCALVSGTALGQQMTVSGTVTSTGGAPLPGVTVRVQGTDARTLTDGTGRYRINAPSDAVLTFNVLGQRPVQASIGGRAIVDITMAQVPYLEEVVVTAYTEQRRADITGAVSSVNIESASRQTGASVLQRLDATVPGITVAASGSPGARSTVRIRGISSFQNNDPLYIIDGTPVQESYLNFLNPNDITSVQVLKDASSASIYGARASNGVILIETTRRGVAGPPQVTVRARTGIATPVRGYDEILITNSLDYFKVMKASYENAGEAVPTNIYGDINNPTVPAFIWPNACPATAACTGVVTGVDAFGRATSVNAAAYSTPGSLIMAGSEGTNWWDAVFGPAALSDYNVDVAGGGEENAYRVSFNYFDQGGTAKYNHFKRGTVRANTTFQRGRLSFGENLSIAVERHNGGMTDDPDDFVEDGILGKNILQQPVIPVFDIAGNFAGGKAKTLGNQGNPLKWAWAGKDDETRNNHIFGNVFAGLDATPEVSFRTRLGFNVAQRTTLTFTPASPEIAEATSGNSAGENRNDFNDWTWTNTLRYVKAFSRHNFDLLIGQEANKGRNRYIEASIGGLVNTALDSRYIQDFLGTSRNVFTTGGRNALLSVFGKADYNFADKYVASFTLRRDGSSRLAPGHQWGTFPAVGLGWRISNEPFLADNRIFSDVMLRYGWGITGNQFIPSGRIVAQFGGSTGDTYYDVTGSNTTILQGYRQTSLGNPNLKWEENKSTNIGADMVLFDGKLNFIVDLYQRSTSNLLFDPRLPATAGVASPPIVNVGKMKNKGIDFTIGHQAASWSLALNGSHYKNEILSIDGVQDFFFGPIATRFGNQVINQVGHPIGSFYGLVTDGYFQTAAEAAAHTANAAGVCATPPCQDGAAPGRFKFKDTNGDGIVNAADRTIIGSPHPDFTAGLDLGLRRGPFDLNATLFGSFGNEIFENQKEFYVFRQFETNVRKDLFENSWTPQNPNAKYPRIDRNDSFSSQLSDFYIEDGSYVRLRNVQLGYTVPSAFGRWLPGGTRVYVQGENLLTFTDYDALDPSLPAANITGAAGDVRDQYRGVDRGAYPSNKVFSIGVVTSF
jgi:TonB-linked SusC/RagA family outer membrane protein